MRSPVRETIELDTKSVCSHARVICVTWCRKKSAQTKQKQKRKKNNNSKTTNLACVFSWRTCLRVWVFLALVDFKTCNRYTYSGCLLVACVVSVVVVFFFSSFSVAFISFLCHVSFVVPRCSWFRLYNTNVSSFGSSRTKPNEYDVSI